ncbi:AprI/Inh family metalloprotease inhibitor [Stenotrophomonas maltophilia]|uniref:AprI/Inh family metalloprotease inhibitor n=1 Tax=Stenotrophomonas maltophilia TaxID=40324 RepID=UPI0039C098AE
MAAVLARTCLFALCCLAPPAFAQDASFGFGEQTTRTDQTTQSGSTQTQSTGAVPTQTTTSGRSQSESRSESKEIDVGLGVHDNGDWDPDRRRDERDVRDSDLFGSWTLGQENGSACTIELKNIAWFGGYSAYVPAGCPDGFFSANRWVLSGNQLLLTDTRNTVFGRFRASGGGRWSGSRDSDGARLYLNPKGR